MADRKLAVTIVGDESDLLRALKRSENATKTFGSNFRRAALGAGAALGVAFGAREVLQGIQSTVDAASDLNEQISRSREVFGESSGEIAEWSRTTANAFAIARSSALEAASGFGVIFQTAGVADQEAGKFSRTLVELAGDLASFNNIPTDDALVKLRAGLVGEAEPLRTLGVLLSEARVEQFAFANGIARVGSQLTDQQKVLARFGIILEDTAKAQGDAARTSDSLANAQRRLRANLTDIQAQVGAALTPAIARLTDRLADWTGDTDNQRRVQQEFNSVLEQARQVFEGMREVITPLVAALKGLVDALGGARNAVKLLLAVMVATSVVNFTQAITGVGTAASVAAGQVTALRAAMLRLAAIGAIAIGIEFFINREEIQSGLNDFLRKHGAGFLVEAEVKLPFSFDIKNLEVLRKTRDHIASIRGEQDILVEALDREIAKREEINDLLAKASGGIVTPGEGRRGDIGARTFAEGERMRAKAAAEAKRAGNDIAATIERQVNQQRTLNQQLEDSITRATRLRNLLTEDPKNKQLQERFREELEKQKGIREDIADAARDAAEADRDAARAQREAAAAARERQRTQQQRDQFRALGLTATGEDRVAGRRALLRRQEALSERIKGTVLDTPKTRSQLLRIRNVLRENFGKVGRDVSLAIIAMFDQISDALNQQDRTDEPLTKFRKTSTKLLTQGLDLTPAERELLRSRLAQVGRGGTVPAPSGFGQAVPAGGGNIVVNGDIVVSGGNPDLIFKEIQRKAKKRAATRTGRKRGSRTGTG